MLSPEYSDSFGKIWRGYVAFAVGVPIILATVIGNTLAVTIIIADAKLHSVNQFWYIANLCICDVVTGVFLMPTSLWTMKHSWEFGDFGCKFVIALIRCLKTEGNLSVVLITYDRVVMIRDGEQYDRHEVRPKAIRNIVLSWIFSLLISFPIMFLFEKIWSEGVLVKDGICKLRFYNDAHLYHTVDHIVWPAVVLYAIEILYPVVLVLIFCTYLAVTTWKRDHEMKQVAHGLDLILFKKEKELSWFLCLFLVSHLICWAPYSVSVLVRMLCGGDGDCLSATDVGCLLWLMWLQSAINPFHYAHAFRRIRWYYERMLCPWPVDPIRSTGDTSAGPVSNNQFYDVCLSEIAESCGSSASSPHPSTQASAHIESIILHYRPSHFIMETVDFEHALQARKSQTIASRSTQRLWESLQQGELPSNVA